MTNWIWTNDTVGKHQLAIFRKKFDISNSRSYDFKISAEANFVAFCDGKEFLRGQYPDYPEDKTFTETKLHLTAGKHVISIEVYYIGEDFQTSWYSEQPGLWCELEDIFTSDDSWKSKLSPALLRDNIHSVTPQVGFAIGYDARNEENWHTPGYDDSCWANAVITDKNPSLSPRPVPIMQRMPYIDGKIVKSGSLKRLEDNISEPVYAKAVNADILDVEGNGFYKIYDLGCERTGLIIIECDCRKEGIIIDISHGEHLNDGKVRNLIEIRNFTDRYITCKGRQRYILRRRAGCRFVQLNIIGCEKDFTLLKCGMEEEMLQLPPTADFKCDDPETAKIHENCIRTLHCCMHEHYEDCPWREQALYSYDSRNQIMFGYYLWGNYEYAAKNWKLFEKGVRPDGFLRLNAPSKLGPPISNFSVVYVTAMYEHYLYSGNRNLFDSLRHIAEGIVNKCIENIDDKTGLYLTSTAEGLWHFYEWRDGLDGTSGSFIDFSGLSFEPRMESIYNLYLIEMFKAMYQLTNDDKYIKMAESQRTALYETFYDKKKKCMLTRFNDERLHGITQILAIVHGVVPQEDCDQLIDRTVNGEFYSVSISSMRYLLELLMAKGGRFIEMADKLIRDIFSPMIKNDSTTMWEADKGAEDFNGAGSMCHGWSALPIYYYYRYLCGIAPIEAGFKTFSVDISRMEKYGDISADITTPHGYIHVEYDKNGKNLMISHPQGLQAVISDRTRASFADIKIKSQEYA